MNKHTRRSEPIGTKPEPPRMRYTYGTAICPYCKREFEKRKAWQAFDTDHCRIMDWQAKHRRKSNPTVVEVDGKKVKAFVLGAEEHSS